jgi:excisionase family DNA binding protein
MSLTETLAALERQLATAASQEIPGLLGQLERIRADLWRRMMSAAAEHGHPQAAGEGDHPLTPEQAATYLGLTVAQLMRRKEIPRLPYGRRTVRFCRDDLDRWLASRHQRKTPA